MTTNEPEESGTQNGAKTPPTLSPVTFYNFADAHRRTLPNRIDKSIMSNVAGGDRQKIINSLRFMNMVTGPQDKPSAAFERLRDAGDDPEALQAAWAQNVREAYPVVFQKLDLSIATQGEIDEAFRTVYTISGDTIRKATTFFLTLCRQAGIPLSSYVKKPRPGGGARPGRPARSRPQREKTGGGAPTLTPPATDRPPPSGASMMVVQFKSGGSAALYVNVDLVAISNADRKALLSWIDAMKRYAAANPVAAPKAETEAETQAAT